MAPRFINPPTIAKPPGYTHVVEIAGPARIIYIAGQLGFTVDGKMPEDFRGQMVQALENVKNALAAVGASFKDVVKINSYIVDIAANIGTFREVRDQYLNMSAPPASTAVGVPALARPGALFEIEAIVSL
jgi:enamine deaminase RidA (YjgF/YER057c/UK114 family)